MLMTGVVLIILVGLACLRLAPGLWPGTVFLMSWWALALAALGAFYRPGAEAGILAGRYLLWRGAFCSWCSVNTPLIGTNHHRFCRRCGSLRLYGLRLEKS